MPDLKLTSVLNMSGDFSCIRRTIAALQAQTAREHLELIIVALRQFAGTIDTSRLACFGAYQIVEVDALPSGASGWAEGFRRARSPVVVISEDHGFPSANWAETLIAAHAHPDDYFAVSPALENANPQTRTSWANYTLSFINFFAPSAPQLVEFGPGHNTSYKREPLLADYGDRLDHWINPERVLHSDLIARGKKILLDSRTSVAHVNISKPMAYLGMSYAGGRLFGASRAEKWGFGRKLFYAAASPLVPFVRLKRLMRYYDTPAKRKQGCLLRTLPLIYIGLILHATGEAVGYLAGAGEIMRLYVDYELRRFEHVIPSERAILMEVATA